MNNLLRVFIAPGEVFDSMKETIEPVPPLLALLLCVAVFTGAQSLFVSDESYIQQAEEAASGMFNFFEGFVERLGGEEAVEEFHKEFEDVTDGSTADELLIDFVGVALTPEQIQTSRILGAFTNPIAALIWVGLGIIILATYFSIVGNSRETRRAWSQWFAFTLWSMMPVALYYLLFLVVTVFTGELAPRYYLAPLAWIPGMQANAFAVNLTFGMVWVIWIQTVGMHRWVDRPLPLCLILVSIPWLLQWLIASGAVEGFKAV